MNTLILQGSARTDGNTEKVVQVLKEFIPATILYLSNFHIEPYNYQHQHQDDFLRVMESVVQYDLLLFATPVYWYAMSGLTKTFLDRITDCLIVEKPLGYQLRGKHMATLACGSEKEAIEGFFVPFRLTANYLRMSYLGDLHTWIEKSVLDPKVETFIKHFAKRLTQRNTKLL